ncbi:hypothetical protein MAR_031111 [Mya arenaria]|uniref:Uncharacterized protein n=1 Tax=Mya arenaria TaxID=6604 RepID=A0ABY7F4H4_MYAAR|nr:hypothetical protein MAR_031111 [Mya arenaria]
MEHENAIRVLKTDKFKLTEELTSKIRMLTHEMTNNDKMTDELNILRGQDDINYQLHHHEKILRAEYMGMKVRYETQLDRLQKEHFALLEVVEKLQREKHLDHDIITGVQKGMASIKNTYTHDLSRWKDERSVLESHIKQIEEGKEIAAHLKQQIEALKRQLSAQEDVQYRMEVAWGKEREEQKRLLNEAHRLAVDLQLNTEGTRMRHMERQAEEARECRRKEQEAWDREKAGLLRRLADMRKLHMRDVRRIDDVLAALKRLRELASIVVDSDTSATLPSNGNDAGGTSGDASAASASVTASDDMSNLKENIDQKSLKFRNRTPQR